jgi:hypothetical protein
MARKAASDLLAQVLKGKEEELARVRYNSFMQKCFYVHTSVLEHYAANSYSTI